MGKIKKICRICGKEYTPCSYCEGDQMAFHYRTICCSRECAKVYLARVIDARKSKEEQSGKIAQNNENEPVPNVSTQSDDTNAVENTDSNTIKKKRTTRKKKREVKDVEQIDESEGALD